MTDFVTKTKITALENEIPDFSSLATKTALTAAENKIANISSLVKKKQIITEKSVNLKIKLIYINYN